jgi:hypothetical protein
MTSYGTVFLIHLTNAFLVLTIYQELFSFGRSFSNTATVMSGGSVEKDTKPYDVLADCSTLLLECSRTGLS